MISHLFLLITCFISPSFTRVLNISLGSIEGKLVRTGPSPHGNQTGLLFLGVPYAKPPLGALRFRDASPLIHSWKHVLKTQNRHSSCFGDPTKTKGNMSEDCLYLNVFTNDYCLMHHNCSVMLAVHGGSMISHSPASFDAEHIINGFVTRNVIVVTISYRLGFFGFAHLNGEHGTAADSNVGLTDVLEGLRFLNREVYHFGGDPERITVYAHSSGAKLLALLTMSSMSNGLFKKQVLMSPGSMLQSKDASTKGTLKVATVLGCANDSVTHFNASQVREIFTCLRNKSSEELFAAYAHVLNNDAAEFGLPWIDGKVVKGSIEELLWSDEYERRDSLIGTAVNEVGWSLYAQHRDGTPKIEEIRELCTILAFEYNYQRPLTTINKCVEYYSAAPHRASHLVDDYYFTLLSCDLIQENVKAGKEVFVYSYSYQSNAPRKDYEQNPKHADDQNFLIRKSDKEAYFEDKEYEIQYLFSGLSEGLNDMSERESSGMIASFINDNDPSPSEEQQWKPFTMENKEYFHIDFDDNLTMPGMEEEYYTDLHTFWRKTIPIFGGTQKPLKKYPTSFDVPQLEFYANARRSLLFNETTTKTLDARRRAVLEISEFVRQLQKAYQLQNDKGMLTIGTFAIILLIVLFSVSRLC